MSNIFNEQLYAEELLKIGPKKYMGFYDLSTLCKYYRYIGTEEKDILGLMLEFCLRFYDGFNELIHFETVKRAIQKSKKYNLRIAKPIPITTNEMSEIRNVNNFRYEKVLFVMLAIAKHHRITTTSKTEPTSKGYFIPKKYSMNVILKLAHVSQKKGEQIFCDLHELGYADKIENGCSILIKFSNADDVSENYLIIEDIYNIVENYKPYCPICKKELVKNSNGHKFCNECWREKRKIDNANKAKRYRNKFVTN